MQVSAKIFGDSLRRTDEWLSELTRIGGFDSPEQAYTALRSVLPTLRDRLAVGEAAQLAAQLPLMIRAIYYEGWRPAATADAMRSKAEFLDEIAGRLGNCEVAPDRACRAVFQLLERHISPGEIDHVQLQMHHRVRELWPSAAAARSETV